MKIVLVDDHSILLDGLKVLIESDSMLEVADAVGSVPDAIRTIDRHKPDLVITDYNLGDDDDHQIGFMPIDGTNGIGH